MCLKGNYIIILLVLAFKNSISRFREWEYEQYQLDPSHFYSLPSLSWIAALKKTGVTLQIFSDMDMAMFIDRALTGGIAMIAHPFAKANNPYMKSYDQSAAKSYIMNFDCTNQYGWAMSQYLPTGNFKWVYENWTKSDILSTSSNVNTKN